MANKELINETELAYLRERFKSDALDLQYYFPKMADTIEELLGILRHEQQHHSGCRLDLEDACFMCKNTPPSD